MQKLSYYRDRGPYPMGRGLPPHLTLVGEMREFLDGVHRVLDKTVGTNPTPITGVEAELLNLPFVLNQIELLGKNARNVFNGVAVDKGNTIDGWIALYQKEAHTLFAAYNRNRAN